MKRFCVWSTVCAAVLLLTGCSTEEKTDPMTEEMTVTVAEGFDADYSACLKTYFEAVENKDFAAYQSVVYPPYLEVYTAYLKESDKTPESAFETLCSRFDEDGYNSWHIAEISLSESTGGEQDIEDFMSAFVSGGVFDEKFKEQCMQDAKEIKDIIFSVGVLYEGDDAPVPAVTDSEILMLKTDSGTYLFG